MVFTLRTNKSQTESKMIQDFKCKVLVSTQNCRKRLNKIAIPVYNHLNTCYDNQYQNKRTNMKIHEIITKVKNTSGTNDKLAILKQNIEDDVLKEYIYLTLSPRVRYFMKSDSVKPLVSESFGELNLKELLKLLEKVKNREITGFTARDYIVNLLNRTIPENHELIYNLLDSDLRCGVNEKGANKIWKDLIPYPKIMLASTDVSRINFPAFSQLKADGVRVLYEDGMFCTRNGSVVEVFDNFNFLDKNIILDGEFVCYDGENPIDRKTSNGIINKAIKGTISEEEAKLIRFLVWDLINNETYAKRFENLKNFCENINNPKIEVIESILVNDIDQAQIHFKEIRKRGLEGTILKNTNAKFEAKRSFNLCKMKAEYEADLEVTGFEYGTGKNENRVGNLLLQSADGLVKVSCGIFKDFPEEVRDEWVINTPKLVTVRYNERITSKSKDTQSLFLPRVIAVREDKNEADTLEKMISEESVNV